MPRCHYHPEADAVAQCRGCGKPLCAACLGDHPDGGPLCPTCQALSAAGDIGRGQAQRRRRTQDLALRQKRRRRVKTALAWGLVALCLGVILARLPVVVGLLRPEAPLRQGAGATDAQTDACIRNLWRQSALLSQGKPPDAALVCPASQKPYRVQTGGDTVVICPDPSRHGLKGLQVSKNHPTPLVRP